MKWRKKRNCQPPGCGARVHSPAGLAPRPALGFRPAFGRCLQPPSPAARPVHTAWPLRECANGSTLSALQPFGFPCCKQVRSGQRYPKTAHLHCKPQLRGHLQWSDFLSGKLHSFDLTWSPLFMSFRQTRWHESGPYVPQYPRIQCHFPVPQASPLANSKSHH